jgi:DNA-binding MarR family transcriptional regulator
MSTSDASRAVRSSIVVERNPRPAIHIVPKRPPAPPTLRTADYARLASFRYALRTFLHFSEAAAAKVGLTGQQYQALLVVRSVAGSAPVTIAELAKQLLIKHNSAVGLADRLVAQGLMVREQIAGDRRKVQVLLTPKGEQVLGGLASIHRTKLRQIGPDIERILGELTGAWRRHE